MGVQGDDRGREASGVAHENLEWGTRRGSARPIEWQKNHGGPATEWAGESICHMVLKPPE